MISCAMYTENLDRSVADGPDFAESYVTSHGSHCLIMSAENEAKRELYPTSGNLACHSAF